MNRIENAGQVKTGYSVKSGTNPEEKVETRILEFPPLQASINTIFGSLSIKGYTSCILLGMGQILHRC